MHVYKYFQNFLKVILQDVDKIDYTVNNELKNLQFFGAGPKTVIPIPERLKIFQVDNKDSTGVSCI